MKSSFIVSTSFPYTHQHVTIDPYVPEPDNMAGSSYTTPEKIKKSDPLNANVVNNWILFIFFCKGLHCGIHVS